MREIQTDKETQVMYRRWQVVSPKAVFLLVHGLGSHSERMGFLAKFLYRNNISSYAIELKGFGETKQPKGHVDSFKTYFHDIECLYKIAQEENKGKKIYLLGESLGALICFLLVQRVPKLFKGLICVTPAFKAKLTFSILEYAKIFLSLLYNPKKQFALNFDSAMCTRDIEYQQIMDEDKRDHRLATSRFLLNTVFAQMRCRLGKNQFKIPASFLFAGRDEIVETSASSKIFEKMQVKDKYVVEYPDMFHALTIDVDRENVFEDILEWVNERL